MLKYEKIWASANHTKVKSTSTDGNKEINVRSFSNECGMGKYFFLLIQIFEENDQYLSKQKQRKKAMQTQEKQKRK